MLTLVKLATAALNAFLLIGKALFGWAIYRAGEKAQQTADLQETVKDDQEAKTIDAKVDAMDRDQLVAAYDERVRKQSGAGS